MESPSRAQISLALAEIERITRECAAEVDELIFYFGHLDQEDPERQVLANRVSTILKAWSSVVSSYGAHPQDLWTVTIPTESGDEIRWQYPCSRLVSHAER